MSRGLRFDVVLRSNNLEGDRKFPTFISVCVFLLILVDFLPKLQNFEKSVKNRYPTIKNTFANEKTDRFLL